MIGVIYVDSQKSCKDVKDFFDSWFEENRIKTEILQNKAVLIPFKKYALATAEEVLELCEGNLKDSPIVIGHEFLGKIIQIEFVFDDRKEIA